MENKHIILLIFMVAIFVFSASAQLIGGTNFNPNGTTLGERFTLIGPDSYYNMRTCEQTLETGTYPLKQITDDPLLNYPIGTKGARPPLFNMIAVSIGTLGTDALGWAMLLLPVIYGMLGIIPMYHIGKDLFGEKVGILSALMYSITSVIVGVKGSTIGRFDHDSFVILLLLLIICCFIKAMNNDGKKAYIYSALTGLFIGATYLTWVVAQIYFFIILIFLVVKLFVDTYQENYNSKVYRKAVIAFFVAGIITLPYSLLFSVTNFLVLSWTGSIVILFLYDGVVKNVNKRITLLLFTIGIISGLLFLSFIYNASIHIPLLYNIADVVFGAGVYQGKLFSTISEGRVDTLSQMVIGIGATTFWLGFLGYYIYFWKKKFDKNMLFFSVAFFVAIWLTITAGRFLSTLSIFLIIMSVVAYYRLNEHFSQSKMKNIISIGLIACLVLPSLGASAYQSVEHYNCDFEHQWTDACTWIAEQDFDLPPSERPALLGWWDYGFFIATMGKHPVVADNYQSGVPTASSYMTATTEKEVIAVMTIRLIEGVKEYTYSVSRPEGIVPPNIREILLSYVDETIISYLEDPVLNAPSYGKSIENSTITVTSFSAMYMDSISEILKLPIEEVNQLYNDISDETNSYIGYLVVTYRDVYELAPIIAYLSDKSSWYITGEDRYFSGPTAERKDAYYETMLYKLYNGTELNYFSRVYNEDKIVIYKYTGGDEK